MYMDDIIRDNNVVKPKAVEGVKIFTDEFLRVADPRIKSEYDYDEIGNKIFEMIVGAFNGRIYLALDKEFIKFRLEG